MEDRIHIPEEVKRQLRREVGYGCPVCRSPFLTWHHFDPAYHVKPHNDPDGMIALCVEHHKEADNWSIERLRALKTANHSVEDVRGKFPSWSQASHLVRLGGVYVGGSQSLFEINSQPLIRLSKNEEGLLDLSFNLFAPDGTLLAVMEENVFSLDLQHGHLYDLVATPGKRNVSVWFEKRGVGLALSFGRITIDKLAKILAKDRKRGERKATKVIKKSFAGWSDEIVNEVLESLFRPRESPLALSGLPEDSQEAMLNGDPVATMVKRWASQNALDSEGKLPFFNFENMAVYYHGQRVTIRNGIEAGGTMLNYSVSLDNARGAINLACSCPLCIGTAQPTSS